MTDIFGELSDNLKKSTDKLKTNSLAQTEIMERQVLSIECLTDEIQNTNKILLEISKLMLRIFNRLP